MEAMCFKSHHCQLQICRASQSWRLTRGVLKNLNVDSIQEMLVSLVGMQPSIDRHTEPAHLSWSSSCYAGTIRDAERVIGAALLPLLFSVFFPCSLFSYLIALALRSGGRGACTHVCVCMCMHMLGCGFLCTHVCVRSVVNFGCHP